MRLRGPMLPHGAVDGRGTEYYRQMLGRLASSGRALESRRSRSDDFLSAKHEAVELAGAGEGDISREDVLQGFAQRRSFAIGTPDSWPSNDACYECSQEVSSGL
jgi:hypothetical protein